jgi:hypothetical protein
MQERETKNKGKMTTRDIANEKRKMTRKQRRL